MNPSEVEQIEAKLYGSIPIVEPEEVMRLINDWRKHRLAIRHLIEMFHVSPEGRYVSVDQMRVDTFEKLKKSVGL